MIAKVEETFGIRFKLKELIKMNNVGDLLTMVKLKTEEQK
jgi:acyl carrier protein